MNDNLKSKNYHRDYSSIWCVDAAHGEHNDARLFSIVGNEDLVFMKIVWKRDGIEILNVRVNSKF